MQAFVVLGILLLSACGGEARSDCELAVHHFLYELTWPRDTKRSPGDVATLSHLEQITLPVCKAEGLSEAQRSCILAAKSDADLPALARCPAIAARRPSWLVIPER